MLISIRGRKPAADEPAGAVAALLDCHERIRRFTAMALRLANAPRDAPADEIAEAARNVLRYFTIALPLHAEDEDRSIRPRIEALGTQHELVAALASMSAEHLEIDAQIASLVPAWDAWAKRAGDAVDRHAMRERTEQLHALWNRHLPPEEQLIFPGMARVLAPSALAEIHAEMRARRPASSFVHTP